MTPAGLHHVAIKAADPERVAAFYRDVLGLPEVARHAMPDGSLRSIWLSCGDAILMVERATAPGSAAGAFGHDPPGIHLVALRIAPEEREAWRARLAVVHETAHTLYVQDPEGNRVGLSSLVTPPRSSG